MHFHRSSWLTCMHFHATGVICMLFHRSSRVGRCRILRNEMCTLWKFPQDMRMNKEALPCAVTSPFVKPKIIQLAWKERPLSMLVIFWEYFFFCSFPVMNFYGASTFVPAHDGRIVLIYHYGSQVLQERGNSNKSISLLTRHDELKDGQVFWRAATVFQGMRWV